MVSDGGEFDDMRRDDGTTLAHLQGPGAPVRQVIAAYALIGTRHLVEIGGAGLPITRFLQHAPQSVTVIDPKITPYEADDLGDRPCRVRHIARKFQAVAIDATGEGLGVAMLGMSLKPFGGEPAVTQALVDLCRRAERVVIEYQLELARPEAHVPELVREARLAVDWSVDFTIRDASLDAAGRGARRLLVLRPATTAEGASARG